MGNNIIAPDFGPGADDTRKKETLAATSKVVDSLGRCGSCGFPVLYRSNDGTEEFRCHGGPKQVVLVPIIQKKVILDGAPQQGNGWTLDSFYPPVDLNDRACALYSPNPAASRMIDLTRKFTFQPDDITPDELEFIEALKDHNKETNENPSD